MSILIGIVALIIFVFVVLYANKRPKRPDVALYWGQEYNRKVELIKGEIVNIRLSKNGENKCYVYFPNIDGYAYLSFEDDIIREIRDEDKKKEETGEYVTIVALAMGLPHGEYIVSVPSGQSTLLSSARIDNPKHPEYDVDTCESIQSKIKNLIYEGNAMLMCAAVMLLLYPVVSLLCSLFAFYMFYKNREFGNFTNSKINGIIWIRVERGRGAIAARKIKKSDAPTIETVQTETDKLLHKVQEEQEHKQSIVCTNCGTVLTDSKDWTYCPYCAHPLSHSDNKEKPGNSEEDIPVPDDDSFFDDAEEFAQETFDASMDDDLYTVSESETGFYEDYYEGSPKETEQEYDNDIEHEEYEDDDDDVINVDGLPSVDSHGREVYDATFIEL